MFVLIFLLILVVLSLSSNEDKVRETKLKERDKNAEGKLSMGLCEVPPVVNAINLFKA